LLHCTRHIFGRLPAQLAALDVIPDEDPEIAVNSARELLKRINDGSGVLVLTDVWGATPSRVASRLAEANRVAVLAGVNLPMLVKGLTDRRRPQPLGDLVGRLLVGGREAVVQVLPQPLAE
jgi:PTS system ascorbate-specific IIA component